MGIEFRWLSAVMLSLLICLSSSQLVLAEQLETVVELTQLTPISEQDLGLHAAEVDSSGNFVLVAGEQGYVHIIDANDPGNRQKDVALYNERSDTIRDIDWHPQGKTALLVGDDGSVLRYAASDQTVTRVQGSGLLELMDLKAVQWRTNGDFAYMGGNGSNLYRYSNSDGFVLLNSTKDSYVEDITCHIQHLLCIVVTRNQGVAVIDNSHQVHWISNTNSNIWLSVSCPNPSNLECVLVASGKRISKLLLNVEAPATSQISSAEIIQEYDGEIIGINRLDDGSNIFRFTPYALASYDISDNIPLSMLEHRDVEEFPDIAGDAIAAVWGSDIKNGYIISTSGNLAQYNPIVEEQEMNMVMLVITLMVAISVPGLVLGMIYMNSKTVQRWYHRNVTLRWRHFKKQD